MSEVSQMFGQRKQASEQKSEARKQAAIQQRLEAQKKQREKEEDELAMAAKKKTRYGGRGTPMDEWLGEAQAGVLKTIFGG